MTQNSPLNRDDAYSASIAMHEYQRAIAHVAVELTRYFPTSRETVDKVIADFKRQNKNVCNYKLCEEMHFDNNDNTTVVRFVWRKANG